MHPAGSSGAAPPRASSPSTSGRSNLRLTAYSSEPQSRGRAHRSRLKWRPFRARSMGRSVHGWRTSSAPPSSDRAADSLATGRVVNPANLTPRELEVLALLGDGLTNAEIAERLFLSEKTVGHHVSAILRKLGVANRVQAVTEAARLGIA